MINLDDFSAFAAVDPQDVLSQIDGLPGLLERAWDLGRTKPLPKWEGIRQVLITGMGGMAVGADLLAAYVSPSCPVPVFIHRGYDLPAWAASAGTLVIALSQTDAPEEILSIFERAVMQDCRVLVICADGGDLAAAALRHQSVVWQFDPSGQRHSAAGFSFGLLLAAFYRLGLVADPAEELAGAVAAMMAQAQTLRADVPLMLNPAKRLAGQCMGRWVSVFGADFLEPVARHWKNQLNRLAKAWAQFEALPEADHNTLAGVSVPESVITNTFALFLQGSANHPRNQLRVQMTKEAMMLEGVGTDFVFASGDSRLSQMWALIHFGDYFAYYLALLYGINPASLDLLDGLRQRLKNG